MKTTLEIPDAIFRKAKATAAEQGQTLQAFVTDALRDKLSGRASSRNPTGPPCMRGFGALRALRKETSRIQRRVDKEFDRVEPEDRA